MSKIHNKSGELSAYGLACGYIDCRFPTLGDGTEVEVRLSYNGCTYDVEAGRMMISPGWVERQDGSKIVEGWAQFDKLGEARSFAKRISRAESWDDLVEYCLEGMEY